MRMHEVCSCGFPHSDTRGSSGICPSPRLFAACRVLLRLPVPRHPPRALLRLTVPCALRALRAFLVHCLCTSTVRCCFPAARPPACRSVAPLLPAAPRGSRRSRAAFTDFVACFFCCLDSPPHGGSSDVFLSFAWLPLRLFRACALPSLPGKLATRIVYAVFKVRMRNTEIP